MSDLALIRAWGEDDGAITIPQGLISLAMYLRKHGYETDVFDRMFDARAPEEFIDDVLKSKPAMIGVTAMTCQFPDALKLIKLLRKRTNAKIILGGIHVTVMPEQGLDVADCVITGEGEIAMLEIASGKRKPEGLIRGIPLDRIDDIPVPDEDLLKKLTVSKEKASILTARGCPYECVFCLSKEQRCAKLRFHSVSHVVDHIEKIVKMFGTEKFFIMDDIFTLHKKRVFEFCDEIEKRGLNLEFQCFSHPHHANLEMFKRMKEAGFRGISIGAESGNDRILKLIKKGMTVSEIVECVKLIKKADLLPGVLFMMGNIGETEETIMDSIRLARSFRCPVHFSLAQPLPGTEFLLVAKDYGTLVHEDYARYTNRDLTFIPKDLTEGKIMALYEYAMKVTEYNKFRRYMRERFPGIRKVYRKVKELMRI